MKRAAAVSLALACAGPDAAEGARPMTTDDARLAEPRACQLESWVRRNAGSTEFWAMPACNPWGGLELAFGVARTRAQGGTAFTDEVVQAKTVLRPLDGNAWGLGLVAGTTRHPARALGNGWPGDEYLNLPLSVAVLRDTWYAHFNAGIVRERDSGRKVGTWGFGNEVRLREDLFLTAEAFRSETGRPFYQLGLRHWVVADRLEIDGSFGTRAGAAVNARWFTLGVHLQFPPFMR